MKSRYIKRGQSNRLILIFADWGCDWRLFADVRHPDYDILVVWDYRDLTFSWKSVLAYDEICLIAWSVGVFAASVTIHEIEPRITLRIAVNGTLRPLDEEFGISPSVWRSLINTLSPSVWRKYQRRMCDSAEQFAELSEKSPKRTIAGLTDELMALETHTLFHVEQVSSWDMAVISRHDAVFPFRSQLKAWKDLAPIRVMDSGHLPDFKQIVSRLIVDKSRVADRFSSALETYGENATVQQSVAYRLMEYFDSVFGRGDIVGNVIEIGPGPTGTLTRYWIDRTDPRARLELWDIVDIDSGKFAPSCRFEQCDAEVRIKRQPTSSAAFIFTASTVHWFNSVREFVRESERVLCPGGYLAVSSFLPGNLEELTSVAGNGLQFTTQSDWKKIVSSNLELLVCESETLRLGFDSPREALEHLRAIGVNSINYGKPETATALKLLRDFPRDPATGKYFLTYRPVYIVARKSEE